MFFSSKSKLAELQTSAKNLQASRDKVKDRMVVAEELSATLGEAVRQTQAMSTKLSNKLKQEVKVARKSITSISAKLTDGMMMLDHTGKVIHLNKAGSKIFGAAEKNIVGKHLSELIECGNNFYDNLGHVIPKPILRENFFIELSSKIFDRVIGSAEKYLACNDCLREALPFCFNGGVDHSLDVEITYQGKPVSLKITLMVLDNDPESLQDINYIFLFGLS